jgi:hypothetical protein
LPCRKLKVTMASASWYLASLVVEARVEGDNESLVHVNVHLLRADSDVSAYETAVGPGFGSDYNWTHTNTEGRQVTTRFRGVSELIRLLDAPIHGAELYYFEHVALSERDICAMVRSKEELLRRDLGVISRDLRPGVVLEWGERGGLDGVGGGEKGGDHDAGEGLERSGKGPK